MRGLKVDGIKGSVREPIIVKETLAGCWECISHKPDQDGYPRLRWAGGQRMNGFFYAQYKGPIPDGMCVCHTCDNRACVNPDHLFLASNVGNTADRHRKNRTAKGEGVGTAKLSDESVLEILRSPLSLKQLAQQFSVTKSTIHKIKTRQSWKHVQEVAS